MTNMNDQCSVKGCPYESEFVAPAYLCAKHWMDWWHNILEVNSDTRTPFYPPIETAND